MSQSFWHTVPSPEDAEPIQNLKLPPKLWHVQHGESQSINLKDGGFQARNPRLDIRTRDALRTEAGRHFIWYTRNWDSCFLSTFDNQNHANNWAMMEHKRYNTPLLVKPVLIYELDTSKLPPGTTILQSTALCLSLGIDHPWKEHEWIFHQQIPASCIIRQYYPWNDYERIFQSSLHLTGLAEALVGAEWLPPRNTNGPMPPSPARTEENQDDLDDLTGRMNGLELENDAGTSNGDTPSGSANEEDVDPNPIVDTPKDSDPVRQEGTDSRPSDDMPKTNDAATEDIDPTPTLDTSNVENAVEENVTDTQLSGGTVVADDSVQGEEVINLISRDDLSKANAGGPFQQKIIWTVDKKIVEAKSSFSVVVQFEVRAADEV
ncbi:hypothetical protein B0H65DRAFT_244247 [Neurospora tetraspora]|uniref:DUF7587 domain-containing protein n=1 Tax=Neurospora tetraspora TaxID=94610 RepID=A0AAE0JDN2_9PEZI|nr:hypothetical protein B0H65DRAFT_244247 [Neurospora tetraspora]